MKQEMPAGPYCYEVKFFREGSRCPDLDDKVSMEPQCKKYKRPLSWTVSGRILKCQECLGGEL